MAMLRLRCFRRATLLGSRAVRLVRGPERAALRTLVVLFALVPVGGAGLTLVDAVKAGNRDAVRAILATPAGKTAVNTPEADGTTALHWAVRADEPLITRELIAAGANPNAGNRYGVTP